MGIKNTLAILLQFCGFLGFSQVEMYTADTEFKGPIKSVKTYDYTNDQSDVDALGLSNENSLVPTCKVCEHFETFDKKGKLIEKQEYVIIEPVSDLGMGYCLHVDLEYKKKELIRIIAKKFEFHDMEFWGYDEESATEDTIYSIKKNGQITTTEYIDVWEASNIKHYKNGLLIEDKYHTYSYDKSGQLIKRVAVPGNLRQRIETWTYTGDLLQEYTSMDTSRYFFGTQTQYVYYPSGKLLSESEYSLTGPNKTDEKELRSIKHFHEDGRDSLLHYVNIYSKEKTKRNFFFEYDFHPNGAVLSKTQKTEDGVICGFETFDARGNLTQENFYNTESVTYKINRYTYNQKGELIEMNVVNDYDGKEYSMIYDYDHFGNRTHTYTKSGDLLFLTQKHVFEYYRN
ncbi:MAG: hypothetical protein AB8B56_06410 [Crocinitomicaceae bacterium]